MGAATSERTDPTSCAWLPLPMYLAPSLSEKTSTYGSPNISLVLIQEGHPLRMGTPTPAVSWDVCELDEYPNPGMEGTPEGPDAILQETTGFKTLRFRVYLSLSFQRVHRCVDAVEFSTVSGPACDR